MSGGIRDVSGGIRDVSGGIRDVSGGIRTRMKFGLRRIKVLKIGTAGQITIPPCGSPSPFPKK